MKEISIKKNQKVNQNYAKITHKNLQFSAKMIRSRKESEREVVIREMKRTVGSKKKVKSKWEKVTIHTPDSGEVEAIAPVIVSASRASDIPAFHMGKFVVRLKDGYSTWTNPFNQRMQYVSFAKTRVIVFWTKDPAPIVPYLDEIEELGFNCYFQVTVNDYMREGWEPYVPPLSERITAFAALAARTSPERVIWRYDPLMLAEGLTEAALAAKVRRIGNLLHPYTRKLVFSFADIAEYRRVQSRLARAGVRHVPFTPESMRSMAERIAEANTAWGLEVATCAEDADFSDLGIQHNRCIDAALMRRLFPGDSALQAFLGGPRNTLPGLSIDDSWQDRLKDSGQRKACGCVVSKDIGAYGTCHHGCLYCYAGGSGK